MIRVKMCLILFEFCCPFQSIIYMRPEIIFSDLFNKTALDLCLMRRTHPLIVCISEFDHADRSPNKNDISSEAPMLKFILRASAGFHLTRLSLRSIRKTTYTSS